MTSNMEITYDTEATLSVPGGGGLQSIQVTVEIEPADAGCLIYGKQADGNMTYVEVRGPKADADLPFAYPEILIKHLGGLQNLKIHTRGYVDSR